jgi:hypothetical protein
VLIRRIPEVAPPAAIGNAVRDGLAVLGAPGGAEVNGTPITAAGTGGDPKDASGGSHFLTLRAIYFAQGATPGLRAVGTNLSAC